MILLKFLCSSGGLCGGGSSGSSSLALFQLGQSCAVSKVSALDCTLVNLLFIGRALFDDLGLVVLFDVLWLLHNLLYLVNFDWCLHLLDDRHFIRSVDVDLVDSFLDYIDVLDNFDGGWHWALNLSYDFIWNFDLDNSFIRYLDLLDSFVGLGHWALNLSDYVIGDFDFYYPFNGNLDFLDHFDWGGHSYLHLSDNFPGVWNVLDNFLDHFVWLRNWYFDLVWLWHGYFNLDWDGHFSYYFFDYGVWLWDGYLNMDSLSFLLDNGIGPGYTYFDFVWLGDTIWDFLNDFPNAFLNDGHVVGLGHFAHNLFDNGVWLGHLLHNLDVIGSGHWHLNFVRLWHSLNDLHRVWLVNGLDYWHRIRLWHGIWLQDFLHRLCVIVAGGGISLNAIRGLSLISI